MPSPSGLAPSDLGIGLSAGKPSGILALKRRPDYLSICVCQQIFGFHSIAGDSMVAQP